MNKLIFEKDIKAAYQLFYGRLATDDDIKYANNKLNNFYDLKQFLLTSPEFNDKKRIKRTKSICVDHTMIKYAYVILLGRYPESFDAYENRINKKVSLYKLVNGIINNAVEYKRRQEIDKYFSSLEFNSEEKIIYLHVPRCAGTSFDQLATKNMEEDVFFLRVEGFDESWYYGKKIIGGHRTINFYDASSNNNLYLAILRDPVERAISLFNYFKNIDLKGYERRINQGFNPDSIMETIENSGFMTQFINNLQCRYLSAHNTFEDTLKIINRNNMILTTMNNIDTWSEYIAEVINWEINKLPAVNITEVEDKRNELNEDVIKYLRDNNSEDLKLYNFINEQVVVDTRKKASS